MSQLQYGEVIFMLPFIYKMWHDLLHRNARILWTYPSGEYTDLSPPLSMCWREDGNTVVLGNWTPATTLYRSHESRKTNERYS
jgi:hypothetical protein